MCTHHEIVYSGYKKKKPNKFVPLVLELIHPKLYASFFVLYNTYIYANFRNIFGKCVGFYLSIFCIIKDK